MHCLVNWAKSTTVEMRCYECTVRFVRALLGIIEGGIQSDKNMLSRVQGGTHGGKNRWYGSVIKTSGSPFFCPPTPGWVRCPECQMFTRVKSSLGLPLCLMPGPPRQTLQHHRFSPPPVFTTIFRKRSLVKGH